MVVRKSSRPCDGRMTALDERALKPIRSSGIAVLLAMALASCGVTSANRPGQSHTTTLSRAPGPRTAAVAHPLADRPLLDILGTLRRPQAKADLDDRELRKQLRFMSRHPAVAGKPVRDLVRFATVAPWGQKVFLVPSILLSRRQVATLPANQRVIATPRRGNALTLSGPGTAGATAAQIKAGRDWGTERSNQLLIVIPDGVAKVTVLPSRTSTNKHPSPVTATVHNNIAAFESRQTLDEPQRELWFGPSGNVIRRIAQPSCRRRCH